MFPLRKIFFPEINSFIPSIATRRMYSISRLDRLCSSVLQQALLNLEIAATVLLHVQVGTTVRGSYLYEGDRVRTPLSRQSDILRIDSFADLHALLADEDLYFGLIFVIFL